MTSEVFYLDALSTGITASAATLDGAATSSLTGVLCSYDVGLDLIENIFQFHTDDTDINDVENSDLLYKTNYVSATDSVFGMNLGTGETDASGNVSVDYIVTGVYPNNNGPMVNTVRPLAQDYVQYLAYNMFNTIQGVDLFNNEQTVRDNLQSSFITAFQDKMNTLAYLTNNSGDVGTAIADGSFTATTGTIANAPPKVILRQIIQNQRTRLQTLSSVTVDEGSLPLYKVPLMVGDIIAFTLVVTSGNDTITSPAQDILDRTYLIKMTIVAAPE